MKQRRGLFYKYVVPIIGIVVVSLSASGAVSIYFSYQETRNALIALQREKAIAAAARIENFVREIEHQIGWTALPQIVEGANPLELRRFDFVKLGRQVPAITESIYIAPDGCVRVRESRLDMSRMGDCLEQASGDPRFTVARTGKTYFGPVYFRKETEPYMAIAMRAGREGAGVTAVEVNLKFIWEVVQQIKVGKKGHAYVLDRDGHLVAHPDISLVLQKTDLSGLPQVKSALVAPAAGEDALQQAAEARDRAGGRVLTAHARIEPLDWTVFVEQPIEEAYAPLYAPLVRIGVLLLAGLALALLASLALARTMVRPVNVLREGAAAIGAGSLDQKIDVRTGDELQDLAEQFNSMAAKLQESYAGLERKVEDRTAELKQALEYQSASAGILGIIASSVKDSQPVFDAIAKAAAGVIQNARVQIFLVQGGNLHHVGGTGLSPDQLERLRALYPAPLAQTSYAGKAILEKRIVHIADVEADGDRSELKRAVVASTGLKAILVVPMIRDGDAIGCITTSFTEAGAFSDKQIALLKSFADQAVIAIQNAQLFREIQEKGQQLEIANRHKSEFLANMSHELRTPLNAIIGFSEVLGEKYFGELNEKQLDYVRDIHASGRHLLSLINDILDLSKIEAGRMELDLADFDLPAALQNAMTLVRERAQRHGIALELKADPALGQFRADERKFKQIMLNLLSNAVKFTPEGGRIGVTAALNGSAVEIAVSDSGVGIAAADQEAIFEEFKQVGSDYTKKAEGTGLGLALTRRFVELHGGTIRVSSAPGQGATFTFRYPCAMANELILIVEDNEQNQKLAGDVLRFKGYRVRVADTAEAGLQIALQERPDVVLMDIHLPGMNGIQALAKLRADPQTQAIPVLAFTASVMPQDRKEITSAGFNGFLSKPINLKEFLDSIAAVLAEGEAMTQDAAKPAKILVVDDTAANVKLLADLLTFKGYEVVTAAAGEEGLRKLAEHRPDLVLLDIMMPGMNGYEVCRAIRADPAHAVLPVVMVTSLDPAQERIKGIEAGADDFLTKPINQPELLARVKSLLRIKSLYDQLTDLNRNLERRVAEGVAELARLGKMKRFLSPQVADLILGGGGEDPLKSHRREITVVFLDLRGFTAFTETSDPEEVMGVLREYHAEMGRLIMAHQGTLERFAGDGIMIFFNDPVRLENPAASAVRMALDMQQRFAELGGSWKKRGYDLGMGIGIAEGYATLGAIGFEERWDYGAIGNVTNVAARLCGEARAGQILVSQRVMAKVEALVEADAAGELVLKGLSRPIAAYNVRALRG